MKRKLLTFALLGMVAALSAQPAGAGTRHVTAKTQRHPVSERARNANAYLPPPVVTYPATQAPYFDEALSPPAGH
jgi:hypothetical protein